MIPPFSDRRLVLLPIVALLMLGLLSGLTGVDTGEAAVIFRLGAVHRTEGAGLTVHLPWPIERVVRVPTAEVRRLEPGSVRLLTGDTNLVDLDLVLQYTIVDPAAFLVGAAEPEQVLSALALAEANDAVAALDVDTLLTTGRAELEVRVQQRVQAAAEALGMGVRIAAVDLRGLAPPPPVVDAFNDVSSARGDRETLALAAESHVSRVLPAARGEAAARIEAAHAHAATRRARAEGDLARFSVLRTAWAADPTATRLRLFGDTWSRLHETTRVRTFPPDANLYLDQPATRPTPPGKTP